MKNLFTLVALILVLDTSTVYAMDIESIDRAKMAQNTAPTRACPSNYVYAKGVGAWAASLDINEDWSFSGWFHDVDMGGGGPGYEHGTELICQYSGTFGEPEQIDEFSYRIPLISLDTEHEEGYEFIEDSVLHIAVGPVGMENTDEFILYLPGTPLSYLSEYVRSWIRVDPYSGALPEDMYLFYNPGEGITFISRASEDTEWLSLPGDHDMPPSDNQFESEEEEKLSDTSLSEDIKKLIPCIYAVICVMGYEEREFVPTKDSDRFWSILYYFDVFYSDGENRIEVIDDLPCSVIDEETLINAAYCIFPDFEGVFPEIPEIDKDHIRYVENLHVYGFGVGNFGDGGFDISEAKTFDDETAVITVDSYYFEGLDQIHSQYYDVYLNKNPELSYGYQIQKVEIK